MVKYLKKFFGFVIGEGMIQSGYEIKQNKAAAINRCTDDAAYITVSRRIENEHDSADDSQQCADTVGYGVSYLFTQGLVVSFM